MKKLLWAFAAYALILTSCTKSEVLDNLPTDNGALTFSTVVGKQTKAAELSNDILKGSATSNSSSAIKLYAYQNTANWNQWFTDNLWYNGAGWQISSTRYRNTSPTKYVTFWPQTAVDVTSTGVGFTGVDFVSTFPSFGYSIKSDQTAQEDLIAGITDMAANQTDILIKMRHLLSQVNFGVKGYNGTQITIANLKVNAIKDSAVYTFGSADTYPLGTWTVDNTRTQSFDYNFGQGNTFTTPAGTVTGDKYIFGDGGSWGPGKRSDTWYVLADGNAKLSTTVTNADKLSNSLMLLPQTLVAGATDAYVSFDYKIQDSDGGYIAGTPTAFANGTFDLNFTTGTTSGTDYLGRWDQNYRYVYIIDFSNFLDDNKLTFRVDVESAPWENYNPGGSNNGGVDIPIIGQPTQSVIDGLVNSNTYYVATNSTTAPTAGYVQVVRSQTWYWDLYTFAGINTLGSNLKIDFSNVIFNGNTIDIIPPTGYIVDTGYFGRATTPGQKILIVNVIDHVFSTAPELQNAFQRNKNERYFFTGDASSINLDSYNVTAGAMGQIKFTGNPPTNAASLTKWRWDAVNKIASYI